MASAKIIPLVSVNALTNQAKATWDRADEKKADADEWYIRTGKLLIELKDRVERGQWVNTIKKMGRSDRRAQELMELARGTKTYKQERERKVNAQRKATANPRSGARIAPAQKLYALGEGQEEERWQNSFANLCGEIISRAPYWNKHFPGWEKFECPSYIRKLMIEATEELKSITTIVNKRTGRS
jgi:hypothetical protein